MRRDPRMALTPQCLRIAPGGAPPGAVEGVNLGTAIGRVEREAVTTDAGHRRLDDALHGTGGDGGIDGIAARAEHLDRGQGCGRVAGRGHTIAPHRYRAAGRLEVTHEG